MFHEAWIPRPHIPCRNTLGPCIWPSKEDFWAWLKYCLLERCILADISWNCLLMSFLSNSKVLSKRFSCKKQPARFPCQIACSMLFKSGQNVMHLFFLDPYCSFIDWLLCYQSRTACLQPSGGIRRLGRRSQVQCRLAQTVQSNNYGALPTLSMS